MTNFQDYSKQLTLGRIGIIFFMINIFFNNKVVSFEFEKKDLANF